MLNIYMVSGEMSEDGAFLVFAKNTREAKKTAWSDVHSLLCDNYLEMRVKRLRGKDWLYKEAQSGLLLGDAPHVVDNPRGCECCGCWGNTEIGADEKCDSCREHRCDEHHHA